uniref:[histone H4]-lysine(20) N-methyltransferase n=1 Tax=Schistosoma mansoni TaxID=6183 RepID=A0A5K4EEB8_SCHMA
MTSVKVSSHSYTLKWEDSSSIENSYSKKHCLHSCNSSSPSLRQTQLNFSPNHQTKLSKQFENVVDVIKPNNTNWSTNEKDSLKSNEHNSYPQTSIKPEPLSVLLTESSNKSPESIITSPTRIMKQAILTETGISPGGNVCKKPIRKKKAATNKKSQVKRSRSVDSPQINTITKNDIDGNDSVTLSTSNTRQTGTTTTTTRVCKSTSVSPKKNSHVASDLCTATRNKQNKSKTQLQTQLTSYGIRKTARQYAKEIEDLVQSPKRERENNFLNALKNNIETGMKIIQTEEKGRGIIATRTFYEGEFVVEYAGDLISEKLAKQREAVYKQNPEIGSYMFFFVHAGQRYCVDATKETPRLGRLINHSRLKPNCIVKVIPIDGIPRLALFARKSISPGEELLYDYGDRDKETLQLHPWLKT